MVGIRPGPQQRSSSPISRPNSPQGAAQDIEEITGASVEGSYNDQIPAVDFRWTWQTKKQAGFEYTRNSLSAGFDRQRGRFEDVAASIASSSLLTHHSNDVNLPFLVETANLSYGSGIFNGPVLSTAFQGRAVWATWYGGALFTETSTIDSTPKQILTFAVNAASRIKTLGILTVSGVEVLAFAAGTTLWLISDLDSGVGAGWTFGVNVADWLLEVPLPKQPVLARAGGNYHLLNSDWSATNLPTLTSANMTNSVRSFSSRLVGLGRVGSRPPFVLSLEIGGRLAYTDVYGMRFSYFQGIDLPTIHQAAFVRDGIAVRDDQRLIYYDGKPWDTRIFRDPEPVSGYFYYLAGFHVVEDTIFAEVNLLPNGVLGASVDLAGIANAKRQTWRLDFDRLRWSPVSEWTEWIGASIAPLHFINPGYNFGSNVGLPAGINGISPMHGSAVPYGSSLPYGPVTRTLHIIPNRDQNLTLRKFEPPPGTSPYAIRGTKSLAVDGTTQGPGMLFPKGPGFDATYLDKYIDGIYWGGQDTGGTGSYLRVRVAEHGRIENTNPSPLTAYFRKGVTHQGRYFPFNSDQAMLFPQEEYFINRGSDTTATLQALPVTFVGHVNLRETEGRRPWLSWGRSKG